MVWIITKDKIDCGEADGVRSRGKFIFDDKKRKFMTCDYKELPTHRFRMLDDDEEVYYEGYTSISSSFDPLDDFGMPNAGCTDIQYRENGEWKSL